MDDLSSKDGQGDDDDDDDQIISTFCSIYLSEMRLAIDDRSNCWYCMAIGMIVCEEWAPFETLTAQGEKLNCQVSK